MSLHSIYLEEAHKTLTTIDPEQISRIADILWQARNEERTVFIFGNGGSAALAVHFAGDVSECTGKAAPNVVKRLRVQCLAENLTTMLAIANDLSYEEIFVEQLKTYFRPGDVVIGVSGSGNSENVIRALQYARSRSGITIGFAGYSGGRLKEVAGECVHIPIHDMQHVEDAHTHVTHMIMKDIQGRMEGESKLVQ